MPIIAMISFCDIMGNLPYCMGICPSNGEILCSFQGFLNLYFFPVSWMYSTMLVYLLRGAFLNRKIPLSEMIIHFTCWIVPLTFTLLILTTNEYAYGGDLCICTIGGTHVDDGLIWHAVTYYGLLYLCCFLMFVWVYQMRQIVLVLQYFRVGIVLFQYPLAMFCMWVPYAAIAIASYFSDDPGYYQDALFVTEQIKILHGAATAVIFFMNSFEARQRWVRLLCPGTKHEPVEEDFFEMSPDDDSSIFSQRLLSDSESMRSSQLVGLQ